MRQTHPKYLRHPNGRGKLLDDAEVALSAKLTEVCTAAGNCQLRDCEVLSYSVVTGNARVFGGTVVNSYVGGDIVVAGDPGIINSILTNRSVTGRAMLNYVVADRFAEVSDSADIHGLSKSDPIFLTDAALVYGKAKLKGSFILSGQCRVHEGEWFRAPKHVNLGFMGVTECVDGKVLVDCRCRPAEYWIKFGAKLGRRWGWSEQQIAATIQAVRDVSAH